MRRVTPALCIGMLLAIPIVGLGMHEPASEGARSGIAGVAPAAAQAGFASAPGGDAAWTQPAGVEPLLAQPSPDGQFAPAMPGAPSVPSAAAAPGVPVFEPPALVGSPRPGAAPLANPTPPPLAAAPAAQPEMTAPTPGADSNLVALFPSVQMQPNLQMPSSVSPPPVASWPPGATGTGALPQAMSAAAPATGATPQAAVASTPDPLAAWGPPPAPQIDPRRFTEAHWQGLELVPNTPRLAAMLSLPASAPGVVVDDVTLPADLQGFRAGDLVTHVAQLPTPHLVAFIAASDQVRDAKQTQVDIVRNGQPRTLVLTALLDRLGVANGDSPPMIPAGARMPHPYRGPCTNCHRIGTTGALGADQGDAMTTAAPDIRVGARRPHEDRGPCAACHRILP